MSFNSFTYIFLFLPLTVGVYFLLRRASNSFLPKAWLFLASLAFLAIGRIEDVVLLLGSLVFNCLIAGQLLKPRQESQLISRKTVLIAGLTANVLFLGYFKYAAFFVQIFNHVFGASVHAPHLSFPLGISFYTIYQIMFLVDCYEGLVEGHNWLDHFVFAGLFPYVTMGPIVRWKQVVPQLNDPNGWRPNADNIACGLYVFVIGLFKKVVLADSFFRWADAGFSYGHPLSLGGSWIAAVAFTFQLYFDFSGYTDMAIGAGLMFNLELPQNFNVPFSAQSVTDFWRRWHMTLTNFITTYLYTPMVRAFARPTFAVGLSATFVAMVIAGFWHGANWTFIVFGALHGIGLVLNQVWRKRKWSVPGPLAWLMTFMLVVVSLVFFRSASVTQASHMVASMFSLKGGLFSYEPWSGIDRIDQLMGVGWMLCSIGILLRAPSSMQLQRTFRPSWTTVALTVGLTVVAFLYTNGIVSRSFVYRDF